MDKGQEVFTFPEDLGQFTQIPPLKAETSTQMVIDTRSSERKNEDLQGIQANTFKKDFGINVEDPTIVESIAFSQLSHPSLTH